MPWIDACSTDEIDPEDLRRLDHGGNSYIIVRDDAGNFYCTDGLCPHEEVHLCDGLVVGNTIECPKHSSIFNLATGEVETPPACEDLRCYPLRIEGGRVLVNL